MDAEFNKSHYHAIHKNTIKGIRATLACILANIILAIVKILTGIIGNSYALIADGIESITDVFSSAVVIGGFTIGSRPPDEKHPFGHGRAESLSAFVVSCAVLMAGLYIAVNAVWELVNPHFMPARYTLCVLVGVIALKEAMFRKLSKIGTDVGNRAMQADAWHNRSDALTSLAAFIGLSIAFIGGERYARADEWAALFASGIIFFNGGRLLKTAVGELMDEQVSEQLAEDIRDIAASTPHVRGVEKCLARKSGRGYFVELHIEVDGAISVTEGHSIAHHVKSRLFQTQPLIINTVVHVEPFVG
jgi:cation diffusion facilitator family transporter